MKFYTPKITDADLAEIKKVQKQHKRNLAAKWIKANAIQIAALVLSVVSIVVAVIAILVK